MARRRATPPKAVDPMPWVVRHANVEHRHPTKAAAIAHMTSLACMSDQDQLCIKDGEHAVVHNGKLIVARCFWRDRHREEARRIEHQQHMSMLDDFIR